MQTASYVALSRQTVLSRMMDAVANNLANASTTGFKSSYPIFQEYLKGGTPGERVAYVHEAGSVRDIAQGNLTHTGNSLDLGIEGNGYFSVNTPDGVRYTRNGQFQLDASRNIVTADGYQVLNANGQPITIPAGTRSITISTSGQVSTETGTIGKLALSQFDDPQSLVPAQGGLYVASGTPVADTTDTINQGTLEASNVQTVTQLTRMMDLQRAYQAAQNMVEGEDSRLQNALDKIAKTV